MNGLDKKNYYLDLCGFYCIGIFCLGYVVFYSSFAEFNLQLPFLNFPIFVGEILLFICLILFLIKYITNLPDTLTKRHYLILGYLCFVVIKAFYGYLKWDMSPLAFRHAALLYYPVFIVFGYAFFRKDFFSRERCLILFLIIIMAFAVKYHDYWTLTLTFLGLILVGSYPDRILKLLMFLALCAVIPYKVLFYTSRMMIVSNSLAGAYLAGMLPVMLKFGRKTKIVLAMMMGTVVILGLYKFADRGALQSIVAFNKMAQVIKANDKYIKENGHYLNLQERSGVKLYNPQGVDRGDYSRSIVYKGKIFTEAEAKEEYKHAVVKDVKERISNFSFEGIDPETQKRVAEEVKKEMASIFDAHLLQQAQANPRELQLPGAETLSIADKVQPVDAEAVKTELPPVRKISKEAQSAEVPPVHATGIVTIESAPIVVVATMPEPLSVKDDAEAAVKKKVDVEDLKVKMRQMLLEAVKKEIQNVSAGAGNFDGQPYTILNDIKQEMQATLVKESGEELPTDPPAENEWTDNNNAVFRIMIWRDMIVELFQDKTRLIYGFDFGKPLRSRSLEILDWGSGDWARDGWVEPHNSFLHIIYRTGVIGLILIFSLIAILFRMIGKFFLEKSFVGIILCGIILHWFTAANFLLIFELPYTAIPIWTIYGMTLAYGYKIREQKTAGACEDIGDPKEAYELVR